MKIGSVSCPSGELETGRFPVTQLPTGGSEDLPIMVARGEESGPTLWIVSAVHGDEVTGLAVAQDVMTEELVDRLRGTVVCLPIANPSGVRHSTRTSAYHGDDPNRYFAPEPTAASRPPRVQEAINARILEAVSDSADALVSLHTSWIDSVPYVIRPRVTYGEHRSEERAERLADALTSLTAAFGLPVVNQFDRSTTLDRSLHRTLAGVAVSELGIPAFTPELGGRFVVEEESREAGLVGIENVLKELDMVDGSPAPNDVFRAPVDGPVKRAVHPYTDAAGIVRYRVRHGERIQEGQPIADIVTPTGAHERTVTTEHDGYVLSRHEGVVAYENDPLADLAIPDESPLVTPYE